MITAIKTFVFAGVGYVGFNAALWVYKSLLSHEEVLRLQLLPNDYMLKNHKAAVLMAGMCLLCQVIAIAALIVTAIMWAVSA